MRPGKPRRSSEVIIRRPGVGLSDAPTTAIEFGLNSASSCTASYSVRRLVHPIRIPSLIVRELRGRCALPDLECDHHLPHRLFLSRAMSNRRQTDFRAASSLCTGCGTGPEGSKFLEGSNEIRPNSARRDRRDGPLGFRGSCHLFVLPRVGDQNDVTFWSAIHR